MTRRSDPLTPKAIKPRAYGASRPSTVDAHIPVVEKLLAEFTYVKVVSGVQARVLKFQKAPGPKPLSKVKGDSAAVARAAFFGTIIDRAIPARTLARRIEADQPLAPREADAIARLLRVTVFANKVFGGDEEMAQTWLTKPNPALSDNVPLDMAKTDVGAREVENILNRIAYGDYS
jgi:putative toxin-antitoxin system antitoxin component (TIGR02293 family)